MRRVRNAVVIIILCIIGTYSMKKKPTLGLMPSGDEMKDSLKGGRAHNASRPLNFGQTTDGDLRDAVAGNAAQGPEGPTFGNTDGGNPPPPRGSGNGGFGPLSNPNPNPPGPNEPPTELSPSGPPTETFQETPQ